jgi:hypothetical protein
MISPVSSSQNIPAASTAAQKVQPPPPKNPPPQDTVHLSLKAAGGVDTDHDGDSK